MHRARKRARSTDSRGLALTLALVLPGAVAAGETAPRDPAADVDRALRELAPTREERRFDEIGWASDIRDGRRLSIESGRPLFLFTHDGRMAVGRC